MQKHFMIGLLALGLLLGAAACSKTSKTSTTSTVTNSAVVDDANVSVNSSGSTSISGTVSTAAEQVVQIVNGQLQTKLLTVAAGTTVVFKNSDTASHQIASNPHPVHTDLPGFDTGPIAPGASASFPFTKIGSWGYHDHLDAFNANLQGTVIVQ